MNGDNTILYLAIGAAVAYYLYTQSQAATTTTTTTGTLAYSALNPAGNVGTFQGGATTVAAYPLCDWMHGYPVMPCRNQ